VQYRDFPGIGDQTHQVFFALGEQVCAAGIYDARRWQLRHGMKKEFQVGVLAQI